VAVPKEAPKTVVGKIFRWCRRQLFGETNETKVIKKTSTSKTVLFDFTLAHIYDRIRLEFRMAVKQAVRNHAAMELLSAQDGGRDPIREKIEQTMKSTLSTYGIKLTGCMMFEFVCPELMTLQREIGETKIADERLKEQGKRMALNKKAALMAHEEERFDRLLDFEDEQTEIKQEGVLGELRDTNAAAAQVRQLKMDATKQDHLRAQGALNVRQDITLGKERGLAENEVDADLDSKRLETWKKYKAIESETKTQEMDQLLRLRKELDGLPPQIQMALLARMDPNVAAMYIAGQQSSGLEQMIEMQKEHAKELSQAHTQGTQQGAQLLSAIVQQMGAVLAANAAARQTPRQVPPPGGGAIEGDNK